MDSDEARDLGTDLFMRRTRTAFLWSRVLHAPFWALFLMLPFILYKDLHATAFQVTTMIVLKPTVALFSLYWSSWITKRRDRLLLNLISAKVVSLIPFFFFPFVDNPWFFVAAFGGYMMLDRGTLPAWMEILKLNVSEVSRARLFAYGSSFGYIGDAIFPFTIGWLLDGYVEAWRWLFPLMGGISLCAVWVQSRIPIPLASPSSSRESSPLFWSLVLQPWKNAWRLIRQRPDFGRYQIGFMLGGSGLMVMQPALPLFFEDKLHLSYTELAVAFTACKGIAFALTSPIWAAWIHKMNIYRFNGLITSLASFFPLFLLLAQFHLIWLYIAYLSYGVMQAGSELSWNMSGPIFAKQEDSSLYSAVNVVAVGIRGCIAPILGMLIFSYFGTTSVMVLGGALGLLATRCFFLYSQVKCLQKEPL